MSVHGDARARNASAASMDSPRCVRIRSITAGSSIVASVMRPPHFGHARTRKWETLVSGTGIAYAKAWPAGAGWTGNGTLLAGRGGRTHDAHERR